jgi:lipid-A-disaccharide synthase
LKRPVVIMLVAGEASGDVLGARLAHVLRARLGADGVRFVGVGGEAMAREGVESPFDIAETSVLGFLEGVMALPRIQRRADDTAAVAKAEHPDIAVLIDSWGFTLRVAQRLRRADPGLPLIKYVGPQVWATRPGRAKTLAKTVDRLLTIHTFDAPYFERAGLATTFVGATALSLDLSSADPARLRREVGARYAQTIVLVLPGSRPAEIARLAAPFADALRRLAAQRRDLCFVLPAAQTVAAQVRAVDWGAAVHIVEGDQLKYDAMKAASVALACSGTVTSELGMAGCPFVVAYRTGLVTYLAARLIYQQRYITLINIAAGEAVAPEFIQQDCTGEALAKALAERLDDPALRARQVARQNATLETMGRGGPDPAERAADVVIEMLTARGALAA